MVLLASWCGLRLGELTELRRSDVDLGDGVIRVRRAMVCVRGEFRVTTPKSEADIRDVNIPPHLLPTADHMASHVGVDQDALVFPARHGGHLAPARCTRPTTGGPRLWPFGHRLGGCVIHFPAVVCTNSPSTCTSLCRKRQLGPPSVGI